MNQSDTTPLATALAALMTGHDANPNTSLRIPLVDSDGKLQPGPTIAELASVLGAIVTIPGTINNVDSIITPCTALTSRNATGAPESNKFGYLICTRHQSYIMQIWVDMGQAKMYLRSTNASVGFTNTSWKLVADIRET